MPEVYLTPATGGRAVELSKTLYRKKILPKGTIDYKGRKITFDAAYLTDLATAYRDGAYDQVPFMLADATNAHTMDPERYRGECKGVEVADDGLWGTFELTADAADLVKKNPTLGVSARIVEGYNRSDGKKYPRAMQHVLGTLDPRIPGLGAWTEVALSGYDARDEVVDLTDASFEGETAVGKKAGEAEETVEGLTRDEYEALLASLDLETDEGAEGEEEEEPAEEGGEEAEEPAEELVAMANTQQTAIELANQEIAVLKRERADERFEADKRDYVRKGVPPALVELTRPVLTAPDGFTLDLSNGVEDKKVDAAAVLRQLLDSTIGYLDLARERGHSLDFSQEEKDTNDPDAEALSMWEKLYPAGEAK